MSFSEPNYQLTYWTDIRDTVREINPTLTKLIDDIDPDKRYPFVRAAYAYGDLIVNEGVTYLPQLSGSLLAIEQIAEKSIRESLNYSTIPLFLLLKNASEVFINFSRPVPLNLFYPGSLLGLFETLDVFLAHKPTARWSVMAGAQNLLMLCKLNEATGLKRLKMAYNVELMRPVSRLTDQWRIFRAITQHKNFKSVWKNEILFFTRNWLLNHKNDRHWLAFKNYLMGQAWQQAQFAIKKVGFSVNWEAFSQAIAERHLKPMPYLVDHVKHILLIGAGHWPAWKAADLSDRVAPVSELQKAIVDVYGLKKYFPTVMHINSLEKESHVPVYYSLSVPTLLEGLPYNTVSSSTILLNLKQIKSLMNIILPAITKLDNEQMKLKKMEFEYYHVENDTHGEVQSSQALETLDSSFLAGLSHFPERKFCATSALWRGCVRIIRSKPS